MSALEVTGRIWQTSAMSTEDAASPTIVILAAGQGTRMQSRLPKVMHPLAGRPMIRHVVATAEALAPGRILVVVGPEMDSVRATVAPHTAVEQRERLGTGHAVRTALEAAEVTAGPVLILFGDVPLVPAAVLERLLAAGAQGLAVLGFDAADPGSYGRLVLDTTGALSAIVEAKDADAATLALRLCNAGMMAADASLLRRWLQDLTANNAQGEYYLTDVVALAREDGHAVAVIRCPEADVVGINTRAQLAAAEGILQARLRAAAMAGGATLIDPASVWFSWDTKLGRDVLVQPSVLFGPGVEIGDGVEIRAFSHLEGCIVAEGAIIGPFARLRPGTRIGSAAHVGNFVELKATDLGDGAKANHLSYLGDASIGARANIGAGTITCNYDGFRKSRTVIGADAFIGSNTALVAPVSIGDGALVAAGATITRNVPADAVAVARADQEVRQGAAARFRERRKKKE